MTCCYKISHVTKCSEIQIYISKYHLLWGLAFKIARGNWYSYANLHIFREIRSNKKKFLFPVLKRFKKWCARAILFLSFLQGQIEIFETRIILHFLHIRWNLFLSEKQIVKSHRNVSLLKQRTKWSCFHRKRNNCSAKYVKFNEIKNKIFLDALSKSNAR